MLLIFSCYTSVLKSQKPFNHLLYISENKKANNERQDKLEKLDRQLKTEQLLKMQAVNKLAEIMARKENLPASKKPKVSAIDLRKKEKECRLLQQQLTLVSSFEFK